MKCAECGTMHQGIRGLLFKPAEKREHYSGPCHKAVCQECLRKPDPIVIDKGEPTEEQQWPF